MWHDDDTVNSSTTDINPWQTALNEAIRDIGVLTARLGLSNDIPGLRACVTDRYPLLVPRSFVERMRPGDPKDPLLRQVLPADAETREIQGYTTDPTADAEATCAPGLLKKYSHRALLLTTDCCPVHCRFCFRRHTRKQCGQPQSRAPLERLAAALDDLAGDTSIHEVILSGGDPLMLDDASLAGLLHALADVPHIRRIRVHTRAPVALPERITPDLPGILNSTRLTPVVVIHTNHANELAGECDIALERLRRAGIVLFNQSVLLRGVNDSVEALFKLSERLIELGVIPYYLHALDRVAGAAHFQVDDGEGRGFITELRKHLPGYATPLYVREIPSSPCKAPLA